MAMIGYRARRIVDGTGGAVREDGVVWFEGERIAGLGGVDEAPSGARIVDLGDVTILPGLIDAHVHMIWDGSRAQPEELRLKESPAKAALRATRHALDTLACGTTTVRDVGAQHGIAIALRDAIAERVLRGPRMLVAGEALAMVGGHGATLNRQVNGPIEARRAAREQLAAGADLVKIVATGGVYGLGHDEPWAPQLTVEEMLPAVEEAHKAGRVAAVHAEGEQGIVNAIEAGADTIEHCNQLTPETARLMAERGIFMVATLAWFFGVAEAEPSPIFHEEYIRKGRIMADSSARSIALAREAGVKIAAGTDTGAPFVAHNSVRKELELLVRLGLTPHEAIQSGNRVAAEAMRLDRDLGTLEPGKYADLIAVGGDPTHDIGALYDLRLVVKGGEVVYPPTSSSPTEETAR
jgi:imidazolonepropionase-like amidohydrolase